MTRRLHITALTGNGMTTEYRALEKPHMGSTPWVPETVQAAARVLLGDHNAMSAIVRAQFRHHANASPGAFRSKYSKLDSALRALAQEDEDDRA